jgi:hypothetical protein
MNETRTCLVKCEQVAFKDGIGSRVSVDKKAIFHRFADDWTYADDAKIPFTSALVEYDDGQLEKVDPDLVKFTDLDLRKRFDAQVPAKD